MSVANSATINLRYRYGETTLLQRFAKSCGRLRFYRVKKEGIYKIKKGFFISCCISICYEELNSYPKGFEFLS